MSDWELADAGHYRNEQASTEVWCDGVALRGCVRGVGFAIPHDVVRALGLPVPSPSAVIHILHLGQALCGKRGVPGEWRDGDSWVRLTDPEKATCVPCTTRLGTF